MEGVCVIMGFEEAVDDINPAIKYVDIFAKYVIIAA